MQKTTVILVIGILYLASKPVAAVFQNQQMNQRITAPVVRQEVRITEFENGQKMIQEFSTDDTDPATLNEVREQMELRREIIRDEIDEKLTTRLATMEAKTQIRQNLLEERLAQRREAIRQRLATRSAQMSQNAREHMSIVAQRVQELHALAEKQAAIGPEIREIARSQQDNQASTAAQLQKVEKRNLLLKLLLGNDEEALLQLNKLQTKNEQQIIQLQTVLDGTKDAEARIVIENMITSLEEQNVLLSQQVKKNGQSFSLFGWVKNIWRR